MSQKIKVLTVSDIHRSKEHYRNLAAAVKAHRPDVVALLGDFLDASGSSDDKLPIDECARALARLHCPEVIFIRGNHEDSAWFTFAEEWNAQSSRELQLIQGGAFVYGPLVIVGFPCLDNSGDGIFDEIPTNPNKWLPKLIRPFGSAGRVLWLMHEPPWGTKLNAEGGRFGGNIEWRGAIDTFAPSLCVFGHDHTTPLKRKCWFERTEADTMCVNVGQTPAGPLHFCLLEFQFPQCTPCTPKKVIVKAFPKDEIFTLPLCVKE